MKASCSSKLFGRKFLKWLWERQREMAKWRWGGVVREMKVYNAKKM